MKEKIKSIFNSVYFKSIIVTLIVLLIIFGIRNLYPFGSQTVSNADGGQAFLPAYYNLWDILHGKMGIFFNFNVGSGTNIYDFTTIYSFLSPLNWIIALTSRNNVVNFINYVLIIKLLFIALTSSILFKKIFKNVSDNTIVLFSFLYALSGYTIVYCTNFSWLDSVGLFPLIIYSLINIIEGKGIKLYVITLTLSLLFSFYISYMSILFIVFSMGIYLFLNRKDKKLDINKIIFELGIGTILSLGISAFATIPVIYQTLHSYRFGISSTANEVGLDINNTLTKLMMLCFYGMPYVFLIKSLLNYKNSKNKKNLLLIIILLVLTTIPIFAERINLMWHTGSYLKFPYRYSFIPIMLIYIFGLSYLNNKNKEEENDKIPKLVKIISIPLLFIALILVYIKFINIPLVSKTPATLLISSKTICYLLVICFISFILTYLITFIKNDKLKNILIVLIILIQVLCNTKSYIGIPRNKMIREHSDETIFYANDIYNYGIKDDTNYKYKDYNNSIIENYPFISRKQSLSTWHMIDNNQYDVHNLLGYTSCGSKLLDKGGNIFTDQVLGVNRIFSELKLKDDYYKFLDKEGKYYIYEYKNTLPYGIIYNTKNSFKDFDYKISRVDNYNNLYKKLFNKKNNIFTEAEYTKKSKNKIDEYTIEIKDKSYLYFVASLKGSIEINVNGKDLKIPLLNSIDTKSYSDTSGMIYLGEYEKENVKIKIKNNDKIKYKPEFILLDSNRYWKFVKKYDQDEIEYNYSNNSLKINLDATANKSLFLPITYNEGLKATVNGKKVEIERALGSYISIKLDRGNNDIKISFTPPYFKISLAISLLSIIAFILLNKYVLEEFKLKLLPKIAKYIFIVVFIGMFIYVYIFPYVKLLLK